jgi:hypothetical protein
MSDRINPHDHPDFIGGWVWTKLEMRWIEQRIADAVAAEREACAQACDKTYYQNIGPEFGEVRHGIAACAAAIRARGQA